MLITKHRNGLPHVSSSAEFVHNNLEVLNECYKLKCGDLG